MSLFECYFLLSCKRSFYNHCYYSSQSGSYKLLFQPGWWRFSLCNNIKPRSFLSSPIIAMHSAAEHLAKGMILLYPPPPVFFIYLVFEKILVLLIVDRRKFLNWSSTWNKPLVMNHLLKSFLLLLIRPACYNYLDLIICRQAGGIWWGSH
jgi:hypothetical protein